MEAIQDFGNQHPEINILYPQSDGFADACKGYTVAVSPKPLAIAQVKQYEEVADLVKLCVANNIPLSVRSGGNDSFARSMVENSLVINLSGLNQIIVNDQTARIGGGVTTAQLAGAMAEHGKLAASGTIGSIGYVGWSTLGGFGPFVGKLGLGIDQILSAKIVNAKGEIEEADQDVLRAIRGGGGNLGIVLEMTIKTYPIRKVFAGTLLFEATDYWSTMLKVLGGIEEMSRDAPAELELQPVYAQSPMGKIFGVLFSWAGDDHDRAKTYLEKVSSFAPVMMNQVTACTNEEFLKSNAGFGLNQVWANPRTLGIRKLSPKVLEVFHKHLDQLPDDLGVAITWHELRSCSPSAGQSHPESVFGMREPHHLVEILAQSVKQENYEVVSEWGEAFYKELLDTVPEEILDSRWVPLTPDSEIPSLDKLFGKDNAAFLVDLKRKRDAGGVFRHAVPRIAV